MERIAAVLHQQAGYVSVHHPVAGHELAAIDTTAASARHASMVTLWRSALPDDPTEPGHIYYVVRRSDGGWNVMDVSPRVGFWGQRGGEPETGEQPVSHFNVHTHLNIGSTACGREWGGLTLLRTDIPKCRECVDDVQAYLLELVNP